MKGKKLLTTILLISILTVPMSVFAEGTTTTTEAAKTKPAKTINVGEKLKEEQKKVAEKAATQQERDQIKAIYTQMKTVEATNRETYSKIVAKRKQVKGFIEQVQQKKISYSDDQLNQITSLSNTLTADVQILVPMKETIKSDGENVRASCDKKDFPTAITNINTELAARQARGVALVKVNGDLDAMLAILTQGQVVAN